MLAPTQAVGGSFKKNIISQMKDYIYIYICEATSCLELQKSAAASVKESEAGNGFEKNNLVVRVLAFCYPIGLFHVCSCKTLVRLMGEQCHH